MTMKKQDRKDCYAEIAALMLKGKNKQAFDKVLSIAADDGGLFIFSDYDKAMEKLKNENQ